MGAWKRFKEDYPKAATGVKVITALTGVGLIAYGLYWYATHQGNNNNKQQTYKVHYGGEKVNLSASETLQVGNGTLEGTITNHTTHKVTPVNYAQEQAAIKKLNKDLETHVLSPIAPDGSTFIENNANNSAIVSFILNNTYSGVNAKNVDSITIHSYTNATGTFTAYELGLKNGTSKVVLGINADKVYDQIDNLKADGSWKAVNEQIIKEKKHYGNLEALVAKMPDNIIDILPKLKEWANTHYNVNYTGTNASELLVKVDEAVVKLAQKAGTQNFTKAKDAMQNYSNFVGNTVGWGSKYANFKALNDTIKNLTYTDIAGKTTSITSTLKTALQNYITDQKAAAISGATAGIQDAVYGILWNQTASDINMNATALKTKFGLRNDTALREIEWKFGKVQGINANADQAVYLSHTTNASNIYMNMSKADVSGLEAAAQTYGEFAHQFRTNLTADLILNETGSARTNAFANIKYAAGQYNWKDSPFGWYNKSISENLVDKILKNTTLVHNDTKDAILDLQGFGAQSFEVYKAGDGKMIIQGYDKLGQRITKTGSEGAFKADGLDYKTVKNL
jgi:hypothetical protein